MPTWNDLAEGSPAIADAGRRLIERSGIGEGLLATVRRDAPPRIHPVNVATHETGPKSHALFLSPGSGPDRTGASRSALGGAASDWQR